MWRQLPNLELRRLTRTPKPQAWSPPRSLKPTCQTFACAISATKIKSSSIFMTIIVLESPRTLRLLAVTGRGMGTLPRDMSFFCSSARRNAHDTVSASLLLYALRRPAVSVSHPGPGTSSAMADPKLTGRLPDPASAVGAEESKDELSDTSLRAISARHCTHARGPQHLFHRACSLREACDCRGLQLSSSSPQIPFRRLPAAKKDVSLSSGSSSTSSGQGEQTAPALFSSRGDEQRAELVYGRSVLRSPTWSLSEYFCPRCPPTCLSLLASHAHDVALSKDHQDPGQRT